MSTFWSGNGGSVVINGTTLNVGKWTVRKTMRLVENTHSGVANTNFEGFVTKLWVKSKRLGFSLSTMVLDRRKMSLRQAIFLRLFFT